MLQIPHNIKNFIQTSWYMLYLQCEDRLTALLTSKKWENKDHEIMFASIRISSNTNELLNS